MTNIPNAVWWVLIALAILTVIILVARWVSQVHMQLIGLQEEVRDGRRSLEATKEKLYGQCEHIRVLVAAALGSEAFKYKSLADGRKSSGSPGEWRTIIETHHQELWGLTGLRESFRLYEQLYNEVAREKKHLSSMVKLYNQTIRSFPGVLIAMLFGMEALDQTEDDEAHITNQFDTHPGRAEHPTRWAKHDIVSIEPWSPMPDSDKMHVDAMSGKKEDPVGSAKS